MENLNERNRMRWLRQRVPCERWVVLLCAVLLFAYAIEGIIEVIW